jgi:hypothetical protein
MDCGTCSTRACGYDPDSRIDPRKRAKPTAPLIQAALERKVVLRDAFRPGTLIVPLIQAAPERKAVLFDAFRWGVCDVRG